jgi:hypothetical protein
MDRQVLQRTGMSDRESDREKHACATPAAPVFLLLAAVDLLLVAVAEELAGVDLLLASVAEELANVDLLLANVNKELAAVDLLLATVAEELAGADLLLASVAEELARADLLLARVSNELSDVAKLLTIGQANLSALFPADQSAEEWNLEFHRSLGTELLTAITADTALVAIRGRIRLIPIMPIHGLGIDGTNLDAGAALRAPGLYNIRFGDERVFQEGAALAPGERLDRLPLDIEFFIHTSSISFSNQVPRPASCPRTVVGTKAGSMSIIRQTVASSATGSEENSSTFIGRAFPPRGPLPSIAMMPSMT